MFYCLKGTRNTYLSTVERKILPNLVFFPQKNQFYEGKRKNFAEKFHSQL